MQRRGKFEKGKTIPMVVASVIEAGTGKRVLRKIAGRSVQSHPVLRDLFGAIADRIPAYNPDLKEELLCGDLGCPGTMKYIPLAKREGDKDQNRDHFSPINYKNHADDCRLRNPQHDRYTPIKFETALKQHLPILANINFDCGFEGSVPLTADNKFEYEQWLAVAGSRGYHRAVMHSVDDILKFERRVERYAQEFSDGLALARQYKDVDRLDDDARTDLINLVTNRYEQFWPLFDAYGQAPANSPEEAQAFQTLAVHLGEYARQQIWFNKNTMMLTGEHFRLGSTDPAQDLNAKDFHPLLRQALDFEAKQQHPDGQIMLGARLLPFEVASGGMDKVYDAKTHKLSARPIFLRANHGAVLQQNLHFKSLEGHSQAYGEKIVKDIFATHGRRLLIAAAPAFHFGTGLRRQFTRAIIHNAVNNAPFNSLKPETITIDWVLSDKYELQLASYSKPKAQNDLFVTGLSEERVQEIAQKRRAAAAQRRRDKGLVITR